VRKNKVSDQSHIDTVMRGSKTRKENREKTIPKYGQPDADSEASKTDRQKGGVGK